MKMEYAVKVWLMKWLRNINPSINLRDAKELVEDAYMLIERFVSLIT